MTTHQIESQQWRTRDRTASLIQVVCFVISMICMMILIAY
jgi:hypothetical protein